MKLTNPLKLTHPFPSSASSPINSNPLNYAQIGRLIQLCTRRRLAHQGKTLHAHLILSSLTQNNFLGSKFVSFYGKIGNLGYARKLFDEIPNKNVFSYNAMMIAYSNHDRFVETLGVFFSFLGGLSFELKPDNWSITCVLKALSGLGWGEVLGREIHCYGLRRGFEVDLFVANALITFYARCDEMGLARRVFDSMGKRDIVSWNSMVSGYAQGGCYEDCVKLYSAMLGVGNVRPNGLTVVSVLQAYAQLNDLVSGMEVHRLVIEKGIEMDVPVCNSLIGLYAKCGSLKYARELFDAMTEKDEITYGCLIAGYMAHGYVEEALNLFKEMQSPRLSIWNALIAGLVKNDKHESAIEFVREMQALGFRPNSVTISSMLPSFSCISNLRAGKEVHGYATRSGLDQNIYVATSIIDTYAKAGFLEGARRVFDQSKDRSVIIWTAVIAAYATHGDVNKATAVFQDMLTHGTQPDPVTFTSVLAAFAHSGAVDEAWELFNNMLPRFGVEPLVEHYACMVGVLSRAGKLSDAVEFISKMPLEPSTKVWGALLHGATASGDVELGKFAFDRMFEIEPENTGNYMIMANLFFRVGKFDEAEKVREKMEAVGLKKIPGTSWIETSRGSESFVARDTLHECIEDIHEALDGLLRLMTQEGRVPQKHDVELSVHC